MRKSSRFYPIPTGIYYGRLVRVWIKEGIERHAMAEVELGVDGVHPVVLQVGPCTTRKRYSIRGAAGGENTTRAMRRASTR